MRLDLLANTVGPVTRLPCGVFLCTAHGELLAANPRFLAWLGVSTEDAGADTLVERTLPARWEPGDSPSHRHQTWLRALRDGQAFSGESHYRRSDGSLITLHQSVASVGDDSGHFIGIALDAFAAPATNENVWYAAHHDAATGLPNQQLLEERLDLRLAALRAHRGTLTAYVIHVRDSGRLRRSGGVPAWTAGLQITAARLRQVAGAHGMAARLGGGEFFLALTGDDPADPATLLTGLGEPIRVGEQVIRPEVCIGAYRHAALDDTAGSDIVHRASIAAADALAAGGSGVRTYSRRLQEALTERWELTRDLARAVTAGQLHLVFQPEIDLQSGRIVAVETLVRWRCPRRGPVSPAVFIPLAEEAGLIDALGSWVLDAACRFARQLHVRYQDAPRVAVNVSPLQLRSGDFAAEVADVLARTGLDPAQLELEITEGVLVDDSVDAGAIFERLIGLGTSLAIDDFGTGYSSLSYLARFPVARLKIDRAFVKDLPHDTRALAIVRAILGLAHGLGMHVTAEGIETDEQAQLLRELGCELGQGFGLIKPLAPDGIRALLTSRYGA